MLTPTARLIQHPTCDLAKAQCRRTTSRALPQIPAEEFRSFAGTDCRYRLRSVAQREDRQGILAHRWSCRWRALASLRHITLLHGRVTQCNVLFDERSMRLRLGL